MLAADKACKVLAVYCGRRTVLYITNSKMDQPTSAIKYYWIGCSGSGYVSMSEDRLESLLDKMPTLRFLLWGHPRMKTKDVEERADGTQILEIPRELQVSKKSFVLLVNCALGVEPLPARGVVGSRWTELVETITTLGGCEELEERFQEHHFNPLTPEQDTNGDFEWQALQKGEFARISEYDVQDMHKLGFSYVSATKDPNSNMVTHLYRKQR